ncbi:MAG: nitrogenase component 1, partial [Holophaga sp.]|nr:nitrogenase component 1 [Holophaga sp.]
MSSKISAEELKQEMLKKYPAKVARKREKQIIVNRHVGEFEGRPTTPQIAVNSRTIPGILSMRGCAYAGCKGVVLGPTRDIVHIVHGPIGCSYYAWLTRR